MSADIRTAVRDLAMSAELDDLRNAVRDLAADAARDVEHARIAWDRAAASLRLLLAYCEQHRDSVAERLCACERQIDCPVHGLQL